MSYLTRSILLIEHKIIDVERIQFPAVLYRQRENGLQTLGGRRSVSLMLPPRLLGNSTNEAQVSGCNFLSAADSQDINERRTPLWTGRHFKM